jgi:hypothetical protein
MRLEEATATNTCELLLTGKFFRAKLLGKAKINQFYAVIAIEHDSDTVYKVYIFGEGCTTKNEGDIFYMKFGNPIYTDMGLSRIYRYAVCDEHGTPEKNYSEEFFSVNCENHF